ncbi:UNVERIFIED_CONTAM: hypothetical protein RMT77_016789 [Armadillidium vulgare]
MDKEGKGGELRMVCLCILCLYQMEESFSKKQIHEAFISGHVGSSPIDIILSVFPIVPGSILAASFESNHANSLLNFTQNYILCILPLILSFTLLKDATLEVCAVMVLLLLLRIPKIQRLNGILKREYDVQDKKLPSLTASRSTVNIATIIAILAVDFHIFPRRFAKTEKYGFSLMDVGAACYLFMNGLTDSRKKSLTRNYVKSILILGSLGILRWTSVKLTNYQEHVSEYGVHCNFFFTLAAIKLLNLLRLHKITRMKRIVIVFSLALIHQLFLNKGLEYWVMSDEIRSGFLSANKEWFVSLPGNFLIYLIGTLVGDCLFDNRQWLKASIVRSTLLPVFPFLFLFILNTVFGLETSRRVVNLPFIVWIVGFFLFFLTIFEVLSNLFGEKTCLIFNSVNDHSLLFFLLGNLFTGIIGLNINTLEVNNFMALVIINLYCYILCYITYILHINKNKSS